VSYAGLGPWWTVALRLVDDDWLVTGFTHEVRR